MYCLCRGIINNPSLAELLSVEIDPQGLQTPPLILQPITLPTHKVD